jgi:hypothetical protein
MAVRISHIMYNDQQTVKKESMKNYASLYPPEDAAVQNLYLTSSVLSLIVVTHSMSRTRSSLIPPLPIAFISWASYTMGRSTTVSGFVCLAMVSQMTMPQKQRLTTDALVASAGFAAKLRLDRPGICPPPFAEPKLPLMGAK